MLALLGLVGVLPMDATTASPHYAETAVPWWLPLLGLGSLVGCRAGPTMLGFGVVPGSGWVRRRGLLGAPGTARAVGAPVRTGATVGTGAAIRTGGAGGRGP